MNEIENVWPKRLDRARTLFLLDVGFYMLKQVRERAPEVEMGGEMESYAEKLRIGLVEEGENEDVIAIYMEGEASEVTADISPTTVLYFKPSGRSPSWVEALVLWGPWPADMVPVSVSSKDTKVISRKGRPDEINHLSDRIYMNRHMIEYDLSSRGAHGVKIGKTGNGIGVVAHEDLGYNVLRREFGLDGEDQVAHWRPAFKATKAYAKKSMAKVIKYVKTGNESAFNLPSNVDKINQGVVDKGKGFSKEIAPFVK